MSSKVLSLRIDAELYEQFKQLAEREDRSVNNLVTRLMKQAVEQSKSTKASATKQEKR